MRAEMGDERRFVVRRCMSAFAPQLKKIAALRDVCPQSRESCTPASIVDGRTLSRLGIISP